MDKISGELSDSLIEVLRQYYYMKTPLGLESFLQGEMKVLSFIHYASCGGEIPTGDITVQLNMTGGRVAEILRSLEKKGYILRRTDENDRRRIMISPTSAGSEKVESGRKMLKERLCGIIDNMGRESAECFIRSMGDFLDACKSEDKD